MHILPIWRALEHYDKGTPKWTAFLILLASFLNLLTPLHKPAVNRPRITSRDVRLIVLHTLQGQLLTIFTSHQTIQFQCGARGSCSQCEGWNGIRLSPGETEETDRDVTGLNEGADCDPWVRQRCSTWAWSSSWKRWAGWHKMREMVRSAYIDIIDGVLFRWIWAFTYVFFVWKKFLLIHILTSNHVVKFWGLDLFSGSRQGYISRLWLDLSVSPEQTQWSFWRRPSHDFLQSLPKPHRLMITPSSTMRQTHFKMSCKTCVSYKGVQNKVKWKEHSWDKLATCVHSVKESKKTITPLFSTKWDMESMKMI